MNVLWISNITLPEAQCLLSASKSIKGSGGWMQGAAENFIHYSGVNLYVASVSRDVKKLTRLEGEKIVYYILPFGKGNNRVNQEYEPLWKQVRDEVNPDIVHLHGTEFSHGVAWIEACGAENVCVSIQGLRHAYYHYSYYGLSRSEIIRSVTLSSLLFGGIMNAHRDYWRCGEYEKYLLSKVHFILGRTSWDKARTWAINPESKYFFGGETLRKEFYLGKTWSYCDCKPHSIFLSQARSPIKGLHMVLRAMPIVLHFYPDATIRVAGPDITRHNASWKDKIKISDYGNIIRKLIKRNRLEKHISFIGPLDASEMCSEYLGCNVFVCPSTIENSPNSLGEAQILGVPVVASYVGGVPDMMKGDEEHLYRFDEVEMLAKAICDIFAQKDTQPQVMRMKEEAMRRHNPERNARELLEIYKEIINRDRKDL